VRTSCASILGIGPFLDAKMSTPIHLKIRLRHHELKVPMEKDQEKI